MKPNVTISVRNLVEFLLKSGDIAPSGGSRSDMQEGTRLHRKLQKEAGADYVAEVRLSEKISYESLTLTVQGIADGILDTPEKLTVDEIKTVSVPLEYANEDYEPLHWAQAYCYAYLYKSSHDVVTVRLSYVQADTEEVRYLYREKTREELAAFFRDLCDRYYVWADHQARHIAARNGSMQALTFPFGAFRPGQREMAAHVYHTVRHKKTVFVQAPTGIGKTMSVLFPSVKAMGEGYGEKIFYLTAKTVVRAAAEQAVGLMLDQGLDAVGITLTAKEKICPHGLECTPQHCPKAKGHYDRVNDAVFDIITSQRLVTKDILLQYAERYRVCPFELGLDVAIWSDLLICDYNYVFDPSAHLRRFFDQKGDYVLLIDEAHNLADRGREMFSATLRKSLVLDASRELKAFPKVQKTVMQMNRVFLDLKKACESEQALMPKPMELYFAVKRFTVEMETFLAKNEAPEKTLELYFESLFFATVFESFYNSTYRTFLTKDLRDVSLTLYCTDPAPLLAETCGKCRASVFFSATLLPLPYYRDCLGGTAADDALRLDSCFPSENLCLMVQTGISTRYKDRDRYYDAVCDFLWAAVSVRKGNYLAFFPSFAYMETVYERFCARYPILHCIRQEQNMDEEMRQSYLCHFATSDETLVAFAVTGGIFSEGIDLPGDLLSGAVIVGVGLPKLCFERDLIRDVFQERNSLGYEYAYAFPGFNRVLQAAGRVIRTERDRGFVLLLDERYGTNAYRMLFPKEWEHARFVRSVEDVRSALEAFYM